MPTRRSIAETISELHSVEMAVPIEERLQSDSTPIRTRAVMECFSRQQQVCLQILGLLAVGKSEHSLYMFDDDLPETTYATERLPLGTVTNGGDMATAQFSVQAPIYPKRRFAAIFTGRHPFVHLPTQWQVDDMGVNITYGGGVNNLGTRPSAAVADYTLKDTYNRSAVLSEGTAASVQVSYAAAYTMADYEQLLGFEETLAMVNQRAQTEDLVNSFY
jgi:hypothetical protein